jgi:hypothetical protein
VPQPQLLLLHILQLATGSFPLKLLLLLLTCA